MSLRRRDYPEVLDNLLTTMIGGVAAEPHAYPPNDSGNTPYFHPLQRPPAKKLVSLYGRVDGESYRFQDQSDFVLSEDSAQITWVEGGKTPDTGSLFYINYLPGDSIYDYKDLHVGSVMRTITEATGLEIARVYAQLDVVYKAGYIDTASGSSLDNVVALLGIKRIKAGRFSGEIEFSRGGTSHGEIHVPAGPRVINDDGSIEYETTASVTMLAGQNTVRVLSRDREENSVGLETGTLTVLAKPIAGIASATNPGPTTLTQRSENDEELKVRAKNFLHGSERGTLAAIKHALQLQGVQADVVEETQVDDLGRTLKTGVVNVIPHVSELLPDMRQRILSAIEQARPVGVNVLLASDVSAPALLDFSLKISTSNQLLPQQLRAAQNTLHQLLQDYFGKLGVAEEGSVNQLIGKILAISGIDDVEIINAQIQGEEVPLDLTNGSFGLAKRTSKIGEVEIIDPNLPTYLNVVIRFPGNVESPNPATIDNQLSLVIAALNESNLGAAPVAANLTRSLLLHLLPLPGKTAGSLTDFAEKLTPDTNETIAPYHVSFVFTKQTGSSQLVEQNSDEYVLSSFEQISLARVELIANTE